MMPLGHVVKPLEQRFWEKVDRSADCWLWMASCQPSGYGQLREGGVGSRMLYAHRVAYELLIGPIPEGMTLDHLCRVRRCVNPAHLEPVSNKENILRGESRAAVNAKKTSCIRGHPFNENNTYLVAKGRACKVCTSLRNRGLLD